MSRPKGAEKHVPVPAEELVQVPAKAAMHSSFMGSPRAQTAMHSSFTGPPRARGSSEDQPGEDNLDVSVHGELEGMNRHRRRIRQSGTELSVDSASCSESEEDCLSNQAAARGDIDRRSSSRSPRNASDRGSSSSDDDFVKVDASEGASIEDRLRKSEEEKLRLNRLLDIARKKADGLNNALQESEQKKEQSDKELSEARSRADGLYENLRDSEEKREESDKRLSEALREIAELKRDMERKDYKLDDKRRNIIRLEGYIRVYHKDLEFQIARARAAEETLGMIEVDRSRFRHDLYQTELGLPRRSLAEQWEHYTSAQDRPPIYLPPRPNHGRETPPIHSSRLEADCPNEDQEEAPILHPTSLGASQADTREMSHPTEDEEQLATEEQMRRESD